MIILAALWSAPAFSSVSPVDEPRVWGEGADYHAAERAHLDLPPEVLEAILRDVAHYGQWVPTVHEVNVLDEGTTEVRATFEHDLPLLPDFVCEVVVVFAERDGGFEVTARFVRCLFDDQSFRARVEPDGAGSVFSIEWSARLDRWFVPDAALRAYLRSAVRSGPRQLDGYAHRLSRSAP